MLHFSKPLNAPDSIRVYDDDAECTLTPSALTVGNALANHVTITPTVCTIQSKEGALTDSISLTSKNVTTTNALGSVQLSWAQIGNSLSYTTLVIDDDSQSVYSMGSQSMSIYITDESTIPLTFNLPATARPVQVITIYNKGNASSHVATINVTLGHKVTVLVERNGRWLIFQHALL
jgi:hypothetical protein